MSWLTCARRLKKESGGCVMDSRSIIRVVNVAGRWHSALFFFASFERQAIGDRVLDQDEREQLRTSSRQSDALILIYKALTFLFDYPLFAPDYRKRMYFGCPTAPPAFSFPPSCRIIGCSPIFT